MRSRILLSLAALAFLLPAGARSTAQAGEILDALSREIASIVTEVSSGVVDITVSSERRLMEQERGARGPFTQQMGTFRQTVQATGFFLDEEGHIITTSAALDGADTIQVTLHDGRIVPAELVGVDRQSRVGVIRIRNEKGYSVPAVGEGCPPVGSLIICFGNQAGLDHSPAFGVVSARNRALSNVLPGYNVIQITAPISAGMAGGPVIDARGEVIGMICATYQPPAPRIQALHANTLPNVSALEDNLLVRDPDSPTVDVGTLSVATSAGGVRIASNVGFALPIAQCVEIGERLILEGSIQRPWLGIQVGDVPEEVREHLRLGPREGVLVHAVISESPAGRVGIEEGDILLRINDNRISSRTDIVRIIDNFVAGDVVMLSIIRDGAYQTLQATLSLRPEGL